ncbi:MAG: class I SAM-dependent methyltransferase [Pseudomonadota bacterium]
MALNGPGGTAASCARARACHMVVDAEPWIYEDRIAGPLVDLDRQIAEGYDLDEIKQPILRETRTVFLVRERFCEHALDDVSAEHGEAQYVVLGAGMNGFAHNGSPLASKSRIFEVDHPNTQTWKRTRLAELGVQTPANLTYVPVDFTAQSLSERLLAEGFDRTCPAVFSWTGVTQYLTDEAINATLREVLALSCPGSILAVQITQPPDLLDAHNKAVLAFFMERAGSVGEPWINHHDPAEFAERLGSIGFSRVEVCTPEDAQNRYVGDRPDGLRVGGYFAMLRAHVG